MVPGLREPPIGSAAEAFALLVPQVRREIVAALDGRGPMGVEALAGWLLLKSRSAIESHLEQLTTSGVVSRREREREASFRLTAGGRALASVLETATAWILSHPRRALQESSPVAWRAFEALAEHWRSAVIEWTVRRSPSESDLAVWIAGFSPRKRREELARLRAAGLVELRRDRDGVRRYRLTEWGRRGGGVLAAAAAWEQEFAADPVEIAIADAIVAFLASLPLVRVDPDLSGLCALTATVEPHSDATPRAGVVWARVRRGRVVGCGEGTPGSRHDAWVSGTFSAWIDAVVRDRPRSLRLGGEEALVTAVVEQIHVQLLAY